MDILRRVSGKRASGQLDENMKSMLRTIVGLVLSGALWLPAAHAATSSAISGPVTVDTQDKAIAVSGRVLDAGSRAPINGATVSLGWQNTSSSGAGMFSFPSVSLNGGNMLTVAKAGYATYTGSVPVPAGAEEVTVQDIVLSVAPAGPKPVVTKVEPALRGLFLSGVTLNNDFTASINWNGVTPGHVRFFVNNVQVEDQTGSGPDYVASLNMGNGPFSPSFSTSGNRVTVQAVGGGGEMSDPFKLYVGILPLPDPIKLITGQGWPFTTFLDGHLGLDYEFPDPPIKTVVTFPVIGRFGFEVAANASFDYTVTDGDWEAALGIGAEGTQGKRGRRPSIPGLTRYPKMKLYVGNKEISGNIQAGARGTATLQDGITFKKIFGTGDIEAKLELGRVGLLDVVPGLSTAAGWVPGVGDVLKGVSVIIYVIPGVNGEITFATQPDIHFDTLELTGKVGLEAAYEPKISDDFELRVYIGGEPSVTFGIPGDLFKNVKFRAYAGAEFKAWLLKLGPVEYVFVDVSYPAAKSLALGVPSADGTIGVATFRVISPDDGTVRPVSRGYLKAGPERFLGTSASQQVTSRGVMLDSNQKGNTLSALDAFRAIGRTAANPLADKAAAAQGQSGLISGAGPQIGQADLPLLENVFPGSDPAMAGHGQDLMLLYVTDNGSPNDLQFTDIRWTRFDGTNWSTPATIETNTQAEFAPQVAYDGNGDAIAVWERVADPNFTNVDLTAMAAQMEVVWSRWNHTSGQWSTPVPLTSNNYLDHVPLVCGPMKNGTVLVTWTANTSNLLMGTNGAGSQVLWAEWNPTSQSWSAEQTLVADLPNRLSQSLSGVSNLAVYAWSQDLNGVLTNADDQQVFYAEWSNGGWGTATQFTSDAIGNRNARASVSPDGHSYLVWQRSTNLVLSRDFSTSTALVRSDSETAGFADYAMTLGPGGNLALIWQEMSQAGSDAHYRVLDPVSATWSKDVQLFNDPTLERSFAPVWDDVGNLTVAYNKVEIIFTNKTVTLEGGGYVTITNVPQPGRVDLCVTKRQLIKDVALDTGNFIASADNYLPGAAVTLSATLRNSGDLAVSNAVVAFYDGNPTNGGVLITNATISGWLEGAGSNSVCAVWVVPEPATNHVLYAMADPAGVISEFDEANNQLSVSLGGTDLAVSVVSQSAETNGAVRVIAQVQNLGAPSATNSVLAVRLAGTTSAPLATVAVPLLEAGRLAQVALDLPAGTQPEGEQLYTLQADETAVTSDVDTNNNSTSFAVNLWIDSDGDGMPDSFEGEYAFLSSTNAADALIDYDGDGLSNLAEYLAGTSLTDPLSYLRMTSIGEGGRNGVRVAWGSASNKLYTLERTSSLLLPFSPLTKHVLSTPPETVYFDASATNGVQYFYRVKLE